MKILVLIGLSIIIPHSFANDRIAFAFEMTRHGARAPLLDDTPGYFSVPPGELT